jgi:FkbM family methyltransferase
MKTMLTRLGVVARLLRRAGLGSLVDALKRRAWRLRYDSMIDVRGLKVAGATVAQLAQARSLAAGRKEALMLDLFERAVRPGMVVLDVGAYVGYFTLLAARGVGETGRVVALEPNRRTFQTLGRNIGANGFGDRVLALPNAVAATSGERPFFADEADPSQSGLSGQVNGHQPDVVECVTADAVLEGATPGVVKIDVEGWEVDVLDSMRDTLRAADDTTLFVELNPEALRDAGQRPEALLERLDDLDFDAYVIDEDARRVHPPAPDLVATIPAGGYVNLLCVPRGRGYST